MSVSNPLPQPPQPKPTSTEWEEKSKGADAQITKEIHAHGRVYTLTLSGVNNPEFQDLATKMKTISAEAFLKLAAAYHIGSTIESFSWIPEEKGGIIVTRKNTPASEEKEDVAALLSSQIDSKHEAEKSAKKEAIKPIISQLFQRTVRVSAHSSASAPLISTPPHATSASSSPHLLISTAAAAAAQPPSSSVTAGIDPVVTALQMERIRNTEILAAQAAAFTAERAKLNEQLSVREAAGRTTETSLTSAIAEQTRLTELVSTLREESRKATEMASHLRSENEKQTARNIADLAAVTEELAKLRATQGEKEAELQTLRTSLQEQRTKTSDFNAEQNKKHSEELAAKEKEVIRLERQTESATAELKRLLSEKSSVEKSQKNAEEQLKRTEEHLSALIAQVQAKAETVLSTVDATPTTATTQRVDEEPRPSIELEEEIVTATRTISQMAETSNSFQREVEALKKQLEQLQSEKSNLQSKAQLSDELATQLKDREKVHDAAEKEKVAIQKKLTAVAAEKQKLQEAIAELTLSDAADLVAAPAAGTVSNPLAAIKQKLSELKQQVAARSETIAALTQKYEDASAKEKALSASINEAIDIITSNEDRTEIDKPKIKTSKQLHPSARQLDIDVNMEMSKLQREIHRLQSELQLANEMLGVRDRIESVYGKGREEEEEIVTTEPLKPLDDDLEKAIAASEEYLGKRGDFDLNQAIAESEQHLKESKTKKNDLDSTN